MIKKKYFKNLNFFLEKKNLFLKKKKKYKRFYETFNLLENYHRNNCKEFKIIRDFFVKDNKMNIKTENYPFLSANMFKLFNLISTEDSKVKTLQSSGTTGNFSKVFLDKQNSILSNKLLKTILEKFLGKEKYIFLNLIKKQELNQNLNAKIAAQKGFSLISKENHFLITNQDKFDHKLFNELVAKNYNDNIVIFGFTGDLWKQFNSNISKLKIPKKNNIILLHGGGWKRLIDKKVSREKFNIFFKKNFKIKNIFQYYGMVEQIGSIFFECREGYFHTHSLSEIFVRDKYQQKLSNKKIGLLHHISLVPVSYPGHSILTEDLGIIEGEDNCKCGLPGKFFRVVGRISKSEIRGCSDAR